MDSALAVVSGRLSRMHGFQSTLALLHWQKAPLSIAGHKLANRKSANLRRIGPAESAGPAARAAIELFQRMLPRLKTPYRTNRLRSGCHAGWHPYIDDQNKRTRFLANGA